MNGYKAYQYYLALKAHFSKPDYDFFKYKGRVKQKGDVYEGRNDRYFFEKFAEEYPTKERAIGFLLCNLLADPYFYIGDFRSSSAEKNYQKWLGIVQALDYTLEQDLRKVEEESIKTGTSFRNIFRIPSGKITSRFLEMTLEGVVSLETYVMVDSVMGLSEYYDKHVFDPLYEDFAFKVKKYSPFVKTDRTQVSATVRKFILASGSFNNGEVNGKDTSTTQERAAGSL